MAVIEQIVRIVTDGDETKAEVVGELIRCRDCKWYEPSYRECTSPNWDMRTDEYFVVPAGFYCGWGERKETENAVH